MSSTLLHAPGIPCLRVTALLLLCVLVAGAAHAQQRVAPEPPAQPILAPTILPDAPRAEGTSRDALRAVPARGVTDSLLTTSLAQIELVPAADALTEDQRRERMERRIEGERRTAEMERRLEAIARRMEAYLEDEAARQRDAAVVLPAWYRPSAPGANRQSAATITVNTLAGDNDLTCGTNGADPTQDCSLLEAVALANTDLAFDRIEFSVAGTIPITAPVQITTPIEIDGTTAPGGAHQVRIDASATTGGISVIGTNANNSVIRGLVVGGSPGNGIAIFSGAQGVRVVGNYIGTDPAGTDLGNAGAGVSVQDASLNVIGGTAVGEGNVIGFNEALGVSISGAAAMSNRLLGNYIGTDAAGANLGNIGPGVQITRAPFNTIGGAGAGEGNVIGFNGFFSSGFAGVRIRFAEATGNRVLGNYIGTDTAGTVMGNGAQGVWIEDAPDNEVGGTGVGEGNVIAFSSTHGVLIQGANATMNEVVGNYLGTNAAGANLGNALSGVAVVDASGNTIGGTAPGAGNTVGFNQEYGIRVESTGSPATGNVIQGNFVGTNADGDQSFANRLSGITILDASDNTVGGSAPGAGNIVGFNNGSGIVIAVLGAQPATGNVVAGNFVGTNAAGANLRNTSRGIIVQDASGNTIGGTAAGAGNTVGFNLVSGVAIASFGQPATGNMVQGNFVGTNAAGDDLGNSDSGILVQNASDNTVGGAEAGAGNTVGFNQFGIAIAADAGATGNVVAGNFVGTNAAGDDLGNSDSGILVQNASDNTIGGTAAGAGNTVGFNNFGVVIRSTGVAPSTGNVVQGNFAGTNAAGDRLGNTFAGIQVQDASDNTIGGSAPGAGNTAGFNNYGIAILVDGGAATGNVVQGNFVGTDAAGADLGNEDEGISAAGASDNTIGGSAPGTGNTVGFNTVGITVEAFDGHTPVGNEVTGNYVGTNAAGADLGHTLAGIVVQDALDTVIGGSLPGAGNTVAFSDSTGIIVERVMAPTTGTVVQGNFVGTNAAGANLGNTDYGIVVEEASGNTIGGSAPGAGNTVGFSNLAGIQIRPDTDAAFAKSGAGTAVGSNTVAGNFVGTNAAGADLGNGVYGIQILNAPNNLIGGTEAGAGNTVGLNDFAGILIQGGTATGNVVQGNFAGTNAAGANLSNNTAGIWVFDAPANTIGSIGSGAANTVGFNTFGIIVQGALATGNAVQNNFAGTNAAGDNLGGLVGIQVQDGSDTIIGQARLGSGNTVGFNTFDGISLVETGAPNTTGNSVRNNLVGTNAAGADLGNENGISVYGASENFIGGAGGTGLEGNTVRHNGTGILVAEYTFIVPEDNAILGNSVFDNDNLGIDLTADPVGDPNSVTPDGVTPNDPDDPDAGPNGFQNYPVLTAATPDSVSYRLDSTPNTDVHIELFASDAPDVSGFGEGERFLLAFEVTTDADGDASGSVSITGIPGVTAGDVVSATATPRAATLSSFGGTSEFSAAVEVEGPPPVDYDLVVTGTDPSGSPIVVARGGQVTFDYSITNNTAAPASGEFWFTASLGGNVVAQAPILSGTLPGGQTVTASFTQNVPGSAPTATYDYALKIGAFPNVAVDTEAFEITVTSSLKGSSEPSARAPSSKEGEAWAVDDVMPWRVVVAEGGLTEGAVTEKEAEEAESAETEGVASSAALPEAFALTPAYPNPFANRATLGFDVPEATTVRLVVYDMLGRAVAVLVDGEVEAGRHETVFDGSGLPSGVYLVRLTTATGFAATQRVTLLR